MADIPEESNVDTESDDIGLGKYEDLSDGDHNSETDEDDDDTQVLTQPELKEQQDDEQNEVLDTSHEWGGK